MKDLIFQEYWSILPPKDWHMTQTQVNIESQKKKPIRKDLKGMNNMSEERFVTLETKIAHQEHAIAELQETVLMQTKELALLKSAIQRLDQNLHSAKEGGIDIGPADEKPPHY